MRAAGALYVFQAVIAAVVLLPIQVLGPSGTLAAAAAGDSTSKLLVDTWVLFGLEVGTIGVALLIASRRPERAIWLVWTVIALELFRGIGHDAYMLVQGYPPIGLVVWIVIHTVLIVTGVVFLWEARAGQGAEPSVMRAAD
jgi:BphX-like